MKVLVSTATGKVLDFLVAKCEGKLPISFDDWSQRWPHYSTDPAQAYPIIDRNKIETRFGDADTEDWIADLSWHSDVDEAGECDCESHGPTILIATMRCFVISRLGSKVEVPDEMASCA